MTRRAGTTPSSRRRVVVQRQQRRQQSNVRKSLWKVAQEPLRGRVVFFTQQPHVVLQSEQRVEVTPGVLCSSDASECVDEPEGTDQERPFAAGQPVDALVRRIARDERS